MAGGWDWLTAMLPTLIMIVVILAIFMGFAKAVGLDVLLAKFMGRQKPIQQKREDYDGLLTRDQKVSAARNTVPAKFLYCQPKDDPEQPAIYYGKIKGVTMESDVVHVLIRRRFHIFHDLLYFPRERMEDVHSKELFLDCAGFERVVKHYWIPVWGRNYTEADRTRLEALVITHKKATMARQHGFIIDEEAVAQGTAGQEPPLRVIAGRAPRVLQDTVAVSQPPQEGEEDLG